MRHFRVGGLLLERAPHGKAAKGINLVALFYCEAGGMRVPVNFRVVDKAGGKTKNEFFREMVSEVLGWGLAPALVTADSWYSGAESLKFPRDQRLRFMIALEQNRLVNERPGEHVRVESVDLPERGQAMHRRHFGGVSVCRTVAKNSDMRHCAAFDPRKKRLKVARGTCQQAHQEHWGSEGCHRASKQVCHAERFFMRCQRAIRNHLFCALRAFVELELQRWRGAIKSWCGLKRHLADESVTNSIQLRTRSHSA